MNPSRQDVPSTSREKPTFVKRLVSLISYIVGSRVRVTLARRTSRTAAIMCALCLMPLAIVYFMFASANRQSATPTSNSGNALATYNDTRLNPGAIPNSPQANQESPTPGKANEPSAAISPSRALVMEGQYYQRNGDYDTAVQKFRTVIFGYLGTSEAADAYMGLAETYKLNRQFKASIETLQEFLQQFPSDPRVDRVLFFIGNNYKALDEWGGATYYYEHYAARAELLRGYAYLNIGDDYFQEGDFTKAIEELKKVLDTDVPRVPRVTAMEKIADSYFWLDQYRSAIDWYNQILSLAKTPDYRADILTRLGRAYAAAGDAPQAEETWGKVIENYPGSIYALQAVESLPPGSNPPTHFYQGLVYYNNDKYDAAIAAFNEYLVRHPDGEDVPRTYYYLALCYRYKGDSGEAFSRLDDVAKTFSNDNVAGDALWQSGLLAESMSRYDESIRRYGRVVDEYPNSQYAQEALFRKGLSHYKLADYNAARATWETLATSPDYASKARFWLAKIELRAGDNDAAQKNLEIAKAGGEADYYVARAKAGLAGKAPFSYNGQTYDLASIINDIPEEKMAFEQWLASWSGQAFYSYSENNLSLRGDAGFRRAEELIRVGSWSDARDEFTELSQKYAKDPVALYEMAMFFRQNGLFYPSISTAMDIANLSPARVVQDTPKFLQKLVYPVYYHELLLTDAGKYGIDPLLLAAVIRQESSFDQNAESGAAAKGLTQVVPSTGRGIAESLGMADFEDDDLFKPYVSVAFGAWYLWNELNIFNKNTFLGLAAYNAGGGNVSKWIGDGGNADDDLFVEDITFAETQSYVKRIFRQYEAYKQIYETPTR